MIENLLVCTRRRFRKVRGAGEDSDWGHEGLLVHQSPLNFLGTSLSAKLYQPGKEGADVFIVGPMPVYTNGDTEPAHQEPREHIGEIPEAMHYPRFLRLRQDRVHHSSREADIVETQVPQVVVNELDFLA